MTTKNNTPSSQSDSNTIKKKTLGDAVNDFVGDRVLNIPIKPAAEKIAKLTDAQKHQLQEIEEKAIANFQGQLDELESALGMLRMVHHFG